MLHDTKTRFIKSEQAEKQFVLLDASNVVLGRLATYAAKLLMGKHKACVTRCNDVGDHVIIINAEKIFLTGDKMNKKKHYWHTGYIGGIKSITARDEIAAGKADVMLKRAVKGMLPKGPLGYKLIKHLHVYNGSEHNHSAQKPVVVDFQAMNEKNKAVRSTK